MTTTFDVARMSDELFDKIARREVDALPPEQRAKVYAQRNAVKRLNGEEPAAFSSSKATVTLRRKLELATREVEEALEEMRPFKNAYHRALTRRRKVREQFIASAWIDHDQEKES